MNDPVTGENVVLRYFTRTSDENSIKTSQYVKSWLEDIGVGVQIKAVSSSKLTSIIEDGDYELFHWGWYPNPDPNYILAIFTCGERAPDAGHLRQQRQLLLQPRVRPAVRQDAERDRPDRSARTSCIRCRSTLCERRSRTSRSTTSQALEAYRSDRVENFTTAARARSGDLLADLRSVLVHQHHAPDGRDRLGREARPRRLRARVALDRVGGRLAVIVIACAQPQEGCDEDEA